METRYALDFLCFGLLFSLFVSKSSSFENQKKVQQRCESLNIPLCKQLQLYDEVQFPNLLQINSQSEARYQLRTFLPLLKNKTCAEFLQPFLCHLYVPPCLPEGVGKIVPPCRQVCKRARSACEVAVEKAGLPTWPSILKCSRFPTGGLCTNDKDMLLSPVSPPDTMKERSADSVTPAGHRSSVVKKIIKTEPKKDKDNIMGKPLPEVKPAKTTKIDQIKSTLHSMKTTTKPKVDSHFAIILEEDPELIIHTVKPTVKTTKAPVHSAPDANSVLAHNSLDDDQKTKYKIIEDHRKDKQHINNVQKPSNRHIDFKPRRTGIIEQGEPDLFQGWVDVQGQGIPNDFCRVIGKSATQRFLSCALAGTTGRYHNYVSERGFDIGKTGSWFMKDMDGDGRDDYCRCVGEKAYSRISCMKAGQQGFYGSMTQPGNQYTFTVPMNKPCDNSSDLDLTMNY